MALSITIRPRELKHSWYEVILTYFKKDSYEYVISLEKNNHLQCALKSDARTCNVRRAITKLLNFKPEDEAENKYWLKITSHDDWKYLVGYCLKENIKYNVQLENDISVYIDYYKNKKSTIGNNDWICTSINSLPWKAYEFYKENYSNWFIEFRTVVTEMCAQGLIPFSLQRKIKKSDEAFWKRMLRPKMSITDLEDLIHDYE